MEINRNFELHTWCAVVLAIVFVFASSFVASAGHHEAGESAVGDSSKTAKTANTDDSTVAPGVVMPSQPPPPKATGASNTSADAPKPAPKVRAMRPIKPDALAALLSEGDVPTILDVRTPEEFAAGHIPGAKNVPEGVLAEKLAGLGLAKDQEVVVHCERGGRAMRAQKLLLGEGYEKVRFLSGHMNRWRASNLPVEAAVADPSAATGKPAGSGMQKSAP